MSGGRFDYIQYRLDDAADHIDMWNTATNYPPEIVEAFREGVKSIRRTRQMIHAIDYLLSGDHNEESFLEVWGMIGEQR